MTQAQALSTAHCSVFIATSLDGFIARPDGAIDWLTGADAADTAGEDYGYAAFLSSVDAIVMGRASLEKVLTFDAWPYGQMPVYALSSSLRALPAKAPGSVSLLDAEPAAVAALAARNGHGRLYVDGGVTIQRFLRAGLIRDMVITTVPVLLGGGRRLFGPLAADVALDLTDSRAYANGLVQSRYKVRHGAGEAAAAGGAPGRGPGHG
ncbi:MAG: dihydrofolate reductase [Ottowia sp.]|nr:MAG: dihydrofolate reductase [Ottowia sp.]